MKRVLSFLLALTLAFSMIPNVFAQTENNIVNYDDTNAADFTYTVANGEATITGYTGEGGNIMLPSELGGYPVTAIGYEAFRNCSSLTGVTIPDSVITIDEYAFCACNNLTDITIGSGVTTIDDYAFASCSKVTSIIIPNSVTSIGMSAFRSCSKLTSITLPNNITSIEPYTFSYCTSLASITIPDSVTTISYYVFEKCTSLTSITIGSGVTSIGNSTFFSCTSLTGIWVKENNLKFSNDDRGVLFNKNKSTLLQAPGAISGSYTAPYGVTVIEDEAFRFCANLTDVIIPSGVTSIGWSAFDDCTSLASATIPYSVTTIEGYGFDECTSLTDVYYTGSQAQWDGIDIRYGNESLTNATLHIVECEEQYVAQGTCGENVNWTLDEEGTLTISGTGAMTDYAYNTYRSTPWYDYMDSIKAVVVEQGVTNVGDYAFFYNQNLISVTLANSVTSVGVVAFFGCQKLENLSLGGVTTIDDEAFKDCGLTTLTIPDSVKTIGNDAFADCVKLTSVTIGKGVTEIDSAAFARCEQLAAILVNEENAVYASVDGVLFDKNKTKLVTYPAGRTGAYTVPDGVTTIGEASFVNHYGITTVKLPDSVKVIEDGAFCMSSLTAIDVGEGLVTIGGSAFSECYELAEIALPESTTTIGGGAFYFCALKNVYLGKGLTYIGSGAFRWTSTENVYYTGTKAQWEAIENEGYNDGLNGATIHYNYGSHTHSYTKKVTKPTCTAKGYTAYTCSCGDSYKANYVGAKGHTYSKGKCTVCGYKPTGAKITAQPTNAVVANGKTAKVTVKASGTGLKYTWYYAKKGSSKFTKTTETSSSYSVKMSSSVNGQKVYCQITDAYGNVVKSSTVTLYKGTAAKITTQPKGITVASGKTGKLTVKASGSSLKYQWYVKYKGASSYTKVGKNSKTYSFTMASKFSGAQAYCVVKDKYGIEVKSSVVTIKLAAKPKITTQPKSVTQVSGKTVKFSVKASGEGLKYQWYYAKKGSSSFKKVSGAKSATYSVKVSSSVSGRKYYCLVTDKYGQTVKSSAATLTLKTVAKITTQPKNVTVKNGKIAKVTIKTVGDGLKYTWYYLKPGATKYVKASATGASYSVKMTAAWKNAKVYCVIADKYGNTVKSSIVTLKMK